MLKRLYTTAGNNEFTHELNSISLLDENAKSLLGRIFNRLLLLADHMSDHLTKRELLPIFSVVLTVLFIALICYTMKYLVKLEEQRIEDTYRKLGKRRPDLSLRPQPPVDKLLIHELRGETYNGLVRLLKPGCRTIVLLCDVSSRNKLLPKFYKAVYPYRK
jgi:DnaJ family protein C protein 16